MDRSLGPAGDGLGRVAGAGNAGVVPGLPQPAPGVARAQFLSVVRHFEGRVFDLGLILGSGRELDCTSLGPDLQTLVGDEIGELLGLVGPAGRGGELRQSQHLRCGQSHGLLLRLGVQVDRGDRGIERRAGVRCPLGVERERSQLPGKRTPRLTGQLQSLTCLVLKQVQPDVGQSRRVRGQAARRREERWRLFGSDSGPESLGRGRCRAAASDAAGQDRLEFVRHFSSIRRAAIGAKEFQRHDRLGLRHLRVCEQENGNLDRKAGLAPFGEFPRQPPCDRGFGVEVRSVEQPEREPQFLVNGVNAFAHAQRSVGRRIRHPANPAAFLNLFVGATETELGHRQFPGHGEPLRSRSALQLASCPGEVLQGQGECLVLVHFLWVENVFPRGELQDRCEAWGLGRRKLFPTLVELDDRFLHLHRFRMPTPPGDEGVNAEGDREDRRSDQRVNEEPALQRDRLEILLGPATALPRRFRNDLGFRAHHVVGLLEVLLGERRLVGAAGAPVDRSVALLGHRHLHPLPALRVRAQRVLARLLERLAPLVGAELALDRDRFLGRGVFFFLGGIPQCSEGRGFQIRGIGRHRRPIFAGVFGQDPAHFRDRESVPARRRNLDHLPAVRVLAGRAFARQLVLELVRVVALRAVENDRHGCGSRGRGRSRRRWERSIRPGMKSIRIDVRLEAVVARALKLAKQAGRDRGEPVPAVQQNDPGPVARTVSLRG